MSEPRTTVVLLAGGSATRLPGKLMLPIDGVAMLARVYRNVTAGGRPCIVSARLPIDLAAFVPVPPLVVLDETTDGGPLVGLVSAAAAVSTALTFAVGGDMPDMDGSFIDALEKAFDAAGPAGAAPDAVIPTWPDGRIEPLAALYVTASLLRAGRAALAAGKRKVASVLETSRHLPYAIGVQDEAKLVNVNTPADYEPYRTRR